MHSREAFHRARPDRDALSIREGHYRSAAKHSSDRLLLALLRYGATNGLPNIDADQCRVKLACIGGVSSI